LAIGGQIPIRSSLFCTEVIGVEPFELGIGRLSDSVFRKASRDFENKKVKNNKYSNGGLINCASNPSGLLCFLQATGSTLHSEYNILILTLNLPEYYTILTICNIVNIEATQPTVLDWTSGLVLQSQTIELLCSRLADLSVEWSDHLKLKCISVVRSLTRTSLGICEVPQCFIRRFHAGRLFLLGVFIWEDITCFLGELVSAQMTFREICHKIANFDNPQCWILMGLRHR